MLKTYPSIWKAGLAALAFATGSSAGIEHAVPATESASAAIATPIAAVASSSHVSLQTDEGLGQLTGATASAGKPFTISRSRDGLFYLDAHISGHPVRFLVDTGANVTVLTRSDAERLGLTGDGMRGAVLETAGGPTSMRWTKIPKMRVANKPITNVDAAVIERGIKVSLLGQNVLSRLNGMTFTGDQLQIH